MRRGAPALQPQELAGDRRDPPLDRGDCRRDHDVAGAPAAGVAAECRRPGATQRGAAAMSLSRAPVVLASASRTRVAMLERAGVAVTAEPAAVDEEEVKHSCRAAGLTAAEVAEALAELKAQRIAARRRGDLVIGADQMLECGGAWFDKPADRAAAVAQLRALSGRTHRLISCAVVIQGGERVWHHTATA